MAVDNQNQNSFKNESASKAVKYELLPPEGGWGYLVMAALALACNVTVIPMTCFGLIFGQFLSSVGDETTGTTLANGIFNTAFNFTGLAANTLLQKFSYRTVGLIGACFFFLGSFSTVLVTNLPQLIISFGIIQGVGMGLLFPACYTALTSYFDKKLNFMNAIAQALMVAASMIFPVIGKFLMDNYGFRGTTAILAAFSLNGILACAVLQPVEWHMVKKPVEYETEENKCEEGKNEPHLKPLLELKMEEGVAPKDQYLVPRPRSSIISVGDRAISVSTINRLGKKQNNIGWWKNLVKSLDLGMFKNPSYCNITLGLSLGFTSDIAFISIIPLILTNSGFTKVQITFLISVFFGSDLVARIIFSIISALFKVKNKYVFLGGCFLTAIFRTAFVLRDGFLWKIAMAAWLGFLRCFVQTPLPLVISDEYSSNFATAFSLYMVVCGVINLLFGPLISFVKAWTGSDIMVVHLLTAAYLTTVIAWIIEEFYQKSRSNLKK